MGGEIPEGYRAGRLPFCPIRGWCDVMNRLGAQARAAEVVDASLAAEVARELPPCNDTCARYSLMDAPVDWDETILTRLVKHSPAIGATACEQTIESSPETI